MISDALRRAVYPHLGPIHGASPVTGGCINRGTRLETDAGSVFLKYNQRAPHGLFEAEMRGLDALRDVPHGLVVPRVIALGEADADVPAWIALEWLSTERVRGDRGERLGRGLAALHRASAQGWGWGEGNFIGSLPQANGEAGSWPAFWRVRRLQPQLDLARRAGRLPGREADWERLFLRLPGLLLPAEADGPSLVHGDLWSGNVMSTAAGPALIDPAVYYGHREVDLAMVDLFGGFGDAFHTAYREAWPLQPGYPQRRPAYQLYYLLVHVNLFGGTYIPQTAAALRQALAG